MDDINSSLAKKCKSDLEEVKKELANVIVGQEGAVDGLLRALLANGHVLVEGIPGIAKTSLIRALAQATGCRFKRIQFTPDLLPTDIVGITSYEEDKGFFVIKGPIFSNFVIADEINRAPPKVQSALLEAMQERQATIGKETFPLDEPFFVLATQNPIETLGTYSLPEAQVDRFLFKIIMSYPKKDEEMRIMERNLTTSTFADFDIKPILSAKRILEMQQLTKQISHSDKIKQYIVELVSATRKPDTYGIRSGKYIDIGASPRASINLFIAAKADAILKGDTYVKPQHIKNVAQDILRHRIILNYSGQAEGIKTEEIVAEILQKVPIP